MTTTIIELAEVRAQRQIATVMHETSDAYSRPAYGEVEWAKCAAILLAHGHSAEITAALLASRLMRWAREDAADYDAPTSQDFERFLNTPAGLSAVSYELAA